MCCGGLGQFPPPHAPGQLPPANSPVTIAPQDNSPLRQLPPWTITLWTTAPPPTITPQEITPLGQFPPNNCPRTIPPDNSPLGQLPPRQLPPGQLPPPGCSYHHMHIRKFHCFFFPYGYFSSHSESEDYAN